MRREKKVVRLDPGLEMLSERLAQVETSCVLATVIAASGSTYRKPGARMLIEADGRITGLLSGGCLEHDLREHASTFLSGGSAHTVTYDMRGDNDLIFGIGSGCEGRMEILLEPLRCGDRVARAIARAAERSQRGEPIALVTIHEGPAERLGTHLWSADANSSHVAPFAKACMKAVESARPRQFRGSDASGLGPCAAWIEPVLPLPAVLICGAGPDTQPLTAALRALHFPITVTDHRASYANAAHSPGVTVAVGAAASLAARIDLKLFFAAVVMSHHLASDTEYLRALGPSRIEYVGVLGPRTRRARLLAELGDTALALEKRMRAPIGLDIGAATPEAIALSIAAEIYAVAAAHHQGRLVWSTPQSAQLAQMSIP